MNKRSKYGKGVNLTSALFWLFHTSNVLNNTLITITKNHTRLQMWVTFKNFQRCLQLLALYLCEKRRKAINKKKQFTIQPVKVAATVISPQIIKQKERTHLYVYNFLLLVKKMNHDVFPKCAMQKNTAVHRLFPQLPGRFAGYNQFLAKLKNRIPIFFCTISYRKERAF